jgi:TRAP-type C4-dicarboxylate transport system permease small subunit
METFIREIAGWVQRRSENLIAALLGIMFVAFIAQIVFRYFFNLPTGWSTELSLICWLWMVLWGTAFALKEKDEIRFDILLTVVGSRTRRAMAVVISAAAVALYAFSLPGTWKYVTFMKVERSSYLNIRLDLLYSIYVIFVVAIVLRYLWLLWEALRGEPLVDDATAEGERAR